MRNTPVFTRTAKAAQSDRLTKWDLIAAIAEDATEAEVPISGIHSVLAAKAALKDAGNEYADGTVKSLCIAAKFDHESSPAQRKVWRRYGWSAVSRVAETGWSPEAAFELLAGDHKSWRDVLAALVPARPSARPEVPLDDRCAQWVSRLHLLLRDGRHLATEAEGIHAVGGHVSMALNFYAAINDKITDAEIRQLLTEETAK